MSLLGKLFRVSRRKHKTNKPRPISPEKKGKIGEKMVDSKLNPRFFGVVEHRQINNLTIVDKNGKSHQIDHIEIRQNGIFCIETKNYSGLIFGDENQEYWTQCLYNGEKNRFLNPIKQNKSHIYHLRDLMDKKYNIISIVVMTQNNANNIKVDNVLNLSDFKKYISNYNDGTHYTIDEMDIIYCDIMSLSRKISNEEHVNNIKETQEKVKSGICPRCGLNLVERDGRYGKFIGCSGFPNCRFILK